MSFFASRPTPVQMIAILLGIAVPSIIIGRTVVGTILSLALILTLLTLGRAQLFNALRHAWESPVAKVIAVTALLWLPGLLVSPDPLRSIWSEVRVLFFIVSAVPLWALLRCDSEVVDTYLRSLIGATVVLGLIAVVSLAGSQKLIAVLHADPNTTATAARILKESASSSALLLPVMLWAVWRMPRRWKWAAVLGAVLLAGIIYGTGSRSALAGVLASGVVFIVYLFLRPCPLRIRCLTLGVATLVAILGSIWLYQIHTISTVRFELEREWPLPAWLIDPPRQAIWIHTWNIFIEHPLTGTGINAIEKMPGASDWDDTIKMENIPRHPHNWAMEVLAETGIGGFLGIIASIGTFLVGAVRRHYRAAPAALVTMLCVWAAYWGSGLFNFSYWSSWWQVSFVVTTAVCLAAAATDRKADQDAA